MGDDGIQEATGVYTGLSPKNQRRLAKILAEQVPEVITADRVIEQKTGYASEICRNMQVDVLAHLGTLAQGQNNLDEDQQASQLAKIEEHLRRAIVEHPEEVLRDRLGDVGELWVEYQQVAFAFREADELHGVPRHKELEILRRRIDVLLEAARKTKAEETTWEESVTASAQMTEAADLASQLADSLHQCIGKAKQLTAGKQKEEAEDQRYEEVAAQTNKDSRSTRNRWIVTTVLTIILALGTLFGGYLLGKHSGSSSSDSGNAPAAARQTETRSGER